MTQISKILFVVYLFLIILYIGFQFTFLPLFLLTLLITSIAAIIGMVQLIIAIKNNGDIRGNALTLILLMTSPLLLLFIIGDNNEPFKEEVLAAYSDGVISGADITFYEDKSMKYCSMSLFGEKCYNGKYELKQDTFIVTYSNFSPSLKFTKMTRLNDRLLFLSESNEIEYKFYLQNKFLDNGKYE